MIPREQFDAYNKAVSNLSDGAARRIESGIWAWLQTDEGRAASVAECREHAKSLMSGVIQDYDEAAASLAAQWYDKQAEDAGYGKLPSAVTATTYDPKTVDETARYQAKKLARGDLRGFARYCGELGRNDVLRSLNETIIRNAGRDKKRGVRFARVPTGAETCTFCLMLAGRGAVYHSRKTAGEFRHFHRRCDCKVVPCFEDDPMAEIVEGHDPHVAQRTWKRIESASVFADGLYGLAENEIVAQAASIDGSIPGLWHEQKIARDYGGIFERFVRGYEGKGSISCQHGAKPEGKELQLASWLSRKGHDIEFLVPSGKEGDHTPDIRLDGELWEIKRILSKNPTKAKSRISDGLRQADSVIVDLSASENAAVIEAAAIEMLEDSRARRIMVIRDGTAKVYRK